MVSTVDAMTEVIAVVAVVVIMTPVMTAAIQAGAHTDQSVYCRRVRG